MKALRVPADRFLLLHAAGPVEFRPAEEILQTEAVRGEHCPRQDDQDCDHDKGKDHQFHGYHQAIFCRKQEYA